MSHIGEAGAVQRLHEVNAGHLAGHHVLDGLQILVDVALGHVVGAVGIGGGLHLGVGDLGQAQLTEHALQGAGGLVAGLEHVLLADGLQAAVDLHVALDDGPVVVVLGVPVGTGEHVVVVGGGGVAGADVVGAGEELRHGTGHAAQVGVGKGLVVGGGGLQIQQHGDQVLSGHGADAAGYAGGHGAVLRTLHAGALGDSQAAGLQVQHALALGIAHLDLGAGAGGKAHLQAAAGVAAGQERLGVGGVVAVHEDGLGAVDGDGLRVGGEAAHAELQLGGLLQGALGHDTGAAHLGAHEQGHGVEGGVTGDGHGGLHLGEAADAGLGGIRRDLNRVVAHVGDVALVGGHHAGAHLGHAHHDLHDVQLAYDLGQLGGGQGQGDVQDLLTGDVDVHDLAGDLQGIHGHGLLRVAQADGVVGDEGVEHIEIGAALAVHLGDDAVLNLDAGLGVEGAVHGDQAHLRPLLYVAVLIDRTGGQNFKTF